MKKNSIFMTGMLAVLLAFGLVLTGCPTDSDDGGGGIDSKLVGTWLNAGEGMDSLTIVITGDGKLTRGVTGLPGAEYDVVENEGTITISLSGTTHGTAKWSVSDDGTTLTLTEGTGDLTYYTTAGSNQYTKQE
jgi:hypothetical protein